MKPVSAREIRKAFLDFFAARGHRVVRSYALVPPNDPTLYFVNAGMVQFKDVFVGARPVEYARAASCQKCLRVSGKHNDLENVGRTTRHHTLFEMLGNFSFGDYFKADAIAYAWELLTGVLGLPVERLHATVHTDDDEAYALWRDRVGVVETRLHRDPDNFWAMGDIGPCGPCSEIYYDLGPVASGGREVPFGSPEGEHRFLEIWNLVFMQFDRAADGTLLPLPKPSIDTGSGLERLALVLQGKLSTFETDLFMPIIEATALKAGVRYGQGGETDVALRVIADHSRAAAFLVADGIYPDNDGRGYVLRRVMRRAIRFGRLLGLEGPFLVDTTAQVVEMMGDAYPELVEARDTVRRIVGQEEKRFGRTIQQGMKRLEAELEANPAGATQTLAGRVAFELYDTYGFPKDLTELICRERGVEVDQPGFDAAMAEQRERARASSKFRNEDTAAYQALVEAGVTTRFSGYERDQEDTTVLALLAQGERVPRAAAGQHVELCAPVTPCYAESGGQVGDTGVITTAGGARGRVEDAYRPFGDLIVHRVVVEEGTLVEGDSIHLAIDRAAREATRKNHTATHLLHAALLQVLGEHVRQRGSLVAPDRLRFDFSHTSGLTSEEVARIEEQVNQLVLSNEPVETRVCGFDEALGMGAIAFFEEKYGAEVRVLRAGHASMELCGGTHCRGTGDIGLFKIVSEGAISSGVRRVEAVTGMNAVLWAQRTAALVSAAADALRAGPEQIVDRIERLIDERKSLAKELSEARVRAQSAELSARVAAARTMGGLRVASARLDEVGGKELRTLAAELRDRLGSGVLLLTAVSEGKANLVVAATADAVPRVHAGQLVSELAALVGGRGGGKPDFAQAGGPDLAGLAKVEPTFYARVEKLVGAAPVPPQVT
jgi:alanyl-tRNA synthetase